MGGRSWVYQEAVMHGQRVGEAFWNGIAQYNVLVAAGDFAYCIHSGISVELEASSIALAGMRYQI